MHGTVLFEIKDFVYKDNNNLKQDENKFNGGILFPNTHGFRPLDSNPSLRTYQPSEKRKAGKTVKFSAPVRDIVLPNEVNVTPYKVIQNPEYPTSILMFVNDSLHAIFCS